MCRSEANLKRTWPSTNRNILVDPLLTVLRVTLISGRTLGQGKGKELGKFSEEYFQSVAVCELNPDDMNLLGLPEGGNVKIKTNFGDVVVKAFKAKQTLPQGLAFIPYGPWASRLMDPETHGSGMPSLKGIEATIVPTPEEEVPKLESLIFSSYGRKRQR
jgi:formylmethanofuran dehydrogenase subunit D